MNMTVVHLFMCSLKSCSNTANKNLSKSRLPSDMSWSGPALSTCKDVLKESYRKKKNSSIGEYKKSLTCIKKKKKIQILFSCVIITPCNCLNNIYDIKKNWIRSYE